MQHPQPRPISLTPAATLAEVENDFRKVSGVERNWRPGQSSTPEQYHERLVKRFWVKVDKTPGLGPKGDCWEWTGSKAEGYGQIGLLINGKARPRRAHAAAWVYIYGHPEPPKGWHVCHECNNKPCVREEHLWAGTPLQNVHHAQASGLMPKVDHALRALLESEAQETRDAHAQISREFIERNLYLISSLRSKEILRMRYGHTENACQILEDVGAHFGITRERVRQIQQLAEERIRMYTVERDVPLPDGNKPGILTEIRDTLLGMAVGDSFVMPRDQNVKISTVAKMLGYLVTTRKISDTEMRVWMVSKPVASAGRGDNSDTPESISQP